MGWFRRRHPFTERTESLLQKAKRDALIYFVAVRQQHPVLTEELKESYERHVVVAALFTAAVSLKAEKLPRSDFSSLTASISEQLRLWDSEALELVPQVGMFVEAEMERLETEEPDSLRFAEHAAEAIGRWVGTSVFDEDLDDDDDMLKASIGTGRLICANYMSYWQ